MLSGTLAEKIAYFAPGNGITKTVTPRLDLFRAPQPEKAHPVVYDPCIIIVGQGQKLGHLGDRQFSYNADNYLVMSLPLPCVCEIVEASPDKPFLAMCIKVDVSEISDLILEMDANDHPLAHDDSIIKTQDFGSPLVAVSTPMNQSIDSIAHRLLDTLHEPDDAKLLLPLYVKELMFQILKGEQGDALRAVTRQNSRFHQISKVMKYMQDHYLEDCSIERLSDIANMSPSSFHQHFKHIASASPVQYLKSIRLHQARSLILQGNDSASSAAASVGYQSGSQFSREYKRLFGVVPSSDLERVR